MHNDKAEEWNNAYSLWLAREHFARGALLVNGDTVHPVERRADPAGRQRGPGVLLAVDDVKTLGRRGDEGRSSTPTGQVRRITKLMDPADGVRRVHRR